MNHAAVADSSVVVKRCLLEEHTDRALAFFGDYRGTGRVIIAPPHLPAEVCNAIYQRFRRRRAPEYHITEREADVAIQAFLLLPIELVAPQGLSKLSFEFAKRHNTPSMYDAIYVVLARMLDVELWTADRRLHNAVATAAPWVRFIGDYPLP